LDWFVFAEMMMRCCPDPARQYQFVGKLDDDSFVHLGNLVQSMQRSVQSRSKARDQLSTEQTSAELPIYLGTSMLLPFPVDRSLPVRTMIGMMYALERPLVRYVAARSVEMPDAHRRADEDRLIGHLVRCWPEIPASRNQSTPEFREASNPQVFYADERRWFQDHPRSNGGLARSIRAESIVVHQCKRDSLFIEVAAFFAGRLLNR
jgi:hypothetical protein